MPGWLSFRQRPEGATRSVVDKPAIEKYVDKQYPGLVAGQSSERITVHDGNVVEITLPDKSVKHRAAEAGDRSYGHRKNRCGHREPAADRPESLGLSGR